MSARIDFCSDGLAGHWSYFMYGISFLPRRRATEMLPSSPFRDLFLHEDVIFAGIRDTSAQFDLGSRCLPFPSNGLFAQSLSSMPETREYHEAKDFSNYGSALHTLFRVPEILAGAGSYPTLPSIGHETETRHWNWSGGGSLCQARTTRSGSVQSQNVWGFSAPAFPVWIWNGDSTFGYNPTTNFPVQNTWGLMSSNSVLQYLYQHGAAQRGQTGASIVICEVTDFAESSKAISYTLKGSIYSDAVDAFYDYKYTFFLDKEEMFDSVTYYDVGDGTCRWLPSYRPSIVFEYITCTRPFDVTSPTEEDLFSIPLLTSKRNWTRSSIAATDSDPLRPLVRNVRYVSSRFFHEVRDVYPDLLSACTFSSAEAVKDLSAGVGNNILQTVVKIPAFSSAVPKLREGVQVASRILRKDLSLATLKELLDLASSTTLQASFQWRPYAELFSKHLPTALAVAKAASKGEERVVGHGKWSYTFLSGELSRPARLVTRTKIVLDSSPRGLLAAILGVDAYGIMPKPSNIWDLLPFSFVANWFTGVGEAIRRLEYSAVLLRVPAYYVHTYTIHAAFTEEELENWSIQSSSPNDLEMKVTIRDISAYAPIPRNTRFGFGLPTSAPPLGVVGALLYQLVFR